MQKTDVRELRKELKKAPNQDGIIDWLYAFYVDAEDNIAWTKAEKYYNLEEEEKFRYAAILNKTVSASIGKDMFPMHVDAHDMEDKRSETDEKEAEKYFSQYAEWFTGHYAHTDPYLGVFMRIMYDVPAKATDGALLEDENQLYEAIVFSLCPAKLSTPSLGLQNSEIEDLTRRWVVGAPSFGFLYPSFSDRAGDPNEVALYIKKTEGMEALQEIFQIEEMAIRADEQKELWNAVLSDIGVSTDEASCINETLCEIAAESDAYIGKERLKKVIEDAGVDGEKFDDAYEKIAEDKELAPAVISESRVSFETDSAKITMSAEKAGFLKTKKIDGIEYILVPVDGVVRLNGAEITI